MACARTLLAGQLGVDTNEKLTAASCMRLTASVYAGQTPAFVWRYLSIREEHVSDLTGDERDAILNSGLALGAVSHVRYPGWAANYAQGKIDGEQALKNAKAVGYLEGCHMGLDLEGCASVGTPVSEYVNAWCLAVIQAHPVILYVGYASGLTADQLYYDLPHVHLYWSDFGPRKVSVRGFALKQLSGTLSLGGVGVDPDRVLVDAKGDAPILMAA